MLSGRGLNPGPPARQTGAYPLNWANRAAVSICKTATPLSSALTSFVVYECGRLQKRLTFLHPSQLGRVGTASLGGNSNQHSQSVSSKLRELNGRTAWRPCCTGSPGTNNLVSVNHTHNLVTRFFSFFQYVGGRKSVIVILDLSFKCFNC